MGLSVNTLAYVVVNRWEGLTVPLHPGILDGMRHAATLSVPEAAAMLGISRNVAYESARNGELAGVPVIRVGEKRLLIPRAPFLRALGIEDDQEHREAE